MCIKEKCHLISSKKSKSEVILHNFCRARKTRKSYRPWFALPVTEFASVLVLSTSFSRLSIDVCLKKKLLFYSCYELYYPDIQVFLTYTVDLFFSF